MKNQIIALILFIVSMLLLYCNADLHNDIIRLCSSVMGLCGTLLLEQTTVNKICLAIWSLSTLVNVVLFFV